MFKVRMQGQYGAATDKRLSAVVSEMWKDYGFRKGVMRGYWVRSRKPDLLCLNEFISGFRSPSLVKFLLTLGKKLSRPFFVVWDLIVLSDSTQVISCNLSSRP
jgi:hypothetical protein